MIKQIKEVVKKYNSSKSEDKKILIVIKAHKAESKEELKKRLKAIKSFSSEDIPQTGAMCYFHLDYSEQIK